MAPRLARGSHPPATASIAPTPATGRPHCHHPRADREPGGPRRDHRLRHGSRHAGRDGPAGSGGDLATLAALAHHRPLGPSLRSCVSWRSHTRFAYKARSGGRFLPLCSNRNVGDRRRRRRGIEGVAPRAAGRTPRPARASIGPNSTPGGRDRSKIHGAKRTGYIELLRGSVGRVALGWPFTGRE